jgi:hypothetical protein
MQPAAPCGRYRLFMTEDCMRTLAIAALSLGIVASASAAEEYYVVMDATSHQCHIANQRPTTTASTVVGRKTPYATAEEAQRAMKDVKLCEAGLPPSGAGPATKP